VADWPLRVRVLRSEDAVGKANANLVAARRAKDDEFYTEYSDIEAQVTAYVAYDPHVFRDKTVLLPADNPAWSNFTKFFTERFTEFGLKRLVSTVFRAEGTDRGQVYILDRDDPTVTKWHWLNSDGDFRSIEVTALRNEADFIITNPPFSLFRAMLSWAESADKKLLLVGNMNAITYKDTFSLIESNRLWLGAHPMKAMTFRRPDGTTQSFGNIAWFTNIDHGRRHVPLDLRPAADNLALNPSLQGQYRYARYLNNPDVIEVPRTGAIPSDYPDVMGVPISFLDKYDPEQFHILGMEGNPVLGSAGDPTAIYSRILIQHVVPPARGPDRAAALRGLAILKHHDERRYRKALRAVKDSNTHVWKQLEDYATAQAPLVSPNLASSAFLRGLVLLEVTEPARYRRALLAIWRGLPQVWPQLEEYGASREREILGLLRLSESEPNRGIAAVAAIHADTPGVWEQLAAYADSHKVAEATKH
jgi:hypothetical protein